MSRKPPAEGPAASPVTCAWCGQSEPAPPLGWTMQTGERGVEWLCQDCTRRNLRGVEGRLATDWW